MGKKKKSLPIVLLVCVSRERDTYIPPHKRLEVNGKFFLLAVQILTSQCPSTFTTQSQSPRTFTIQSHYAVTFENGACAHKARKT